MGRGSEEQVRKTIESYKAVAAEIAAIRPETVIVTSPHAVMYADWFHISPGDHASGDFGSFRAPGVKFRKEYDTELVRRICAIAERKDFPAGTAGERDRHLDHGTMVPLYFIDRQYKDYKLVRIGLSGLPLPDHYVFGQIVIDRFAVYAGKKFTFIEEGNDLIKKHSERDEGFVMLSSHVGNYELTGCTFDASKKRVNALVYAGESEAIMESRKKILAKHNIGLILVGNDMSHIFQMNTAIDNGIL